MNFNYRTMCGALVVLFASAAIAQTPASEVASQGAAAPPATKAQRHAEKKATKVANRALSKKVQRALNQTKGLNNTEITVFATASTGQVVLAGTIADEQQEQIATHVAQGVPGVKSVSSRLTLHEEGGQ